MDDVNRSGGGFFHWILHRHANQRFLPLEIARIHALDSRPGSCVAGEPDCCLSMDRANVGASHRRSEIGNVARQQVRRLGILQMPEPPLSICGGRPQGVAQHSLAGDCVALKARVIACKQRQFINRRVAKDAASGFARERGQRPLRRKQLGPEFSQEFVGLHEPVHDVIGISRGLNLLAV